MLHLADRDINALCERYRAQRLAEDEQQRARGLAPTTHEIDLDLLDVALPRMRSAHARGGLGGVYPDLQSFVDEIGLKLSRTSLTQHTGLPTRETASAKPTRRVRPR